MARGNIAYELRQAYLSSSDTFLPVNGPYAVPKGWLLAYGPTVPTDAASNYKPGALFVHTDGSAGTELYVNQGSQTSCDFNPVLSTTILSQVSMTRTLTGQSTENIGHSVAMTTDSSYITGDNMTYSSARGSSALKIVSTFTGVGGGFSNIYSNITTTAAQVTDGAGVVGIKGVVTNTAALTEGEVYGAQFIAKHNHASNIMLATASLIGLEAWAYIADAGVARTVIGGNIGWHNEATGATYGSGSVIRGIQVFCDNASGAGVPTESTGICVWNQAGAITNVFKVVNSSSGFTYLLAMTDDGAPAQSTSTTVTNVGSKGWAKCIIGSAVRYIPFGDGVT